MSLPSLQIGLLTAGGGSPSAAGGAGSAAAAARLSLPVLGAAAAAGCGLWCVPCRWSALPHTFLLQQTTLLAAAVSACATAALDPAGGGGGGVAAYGSLLTAALLGLAVGGMDVFAARQLARLFIQEEAVSVEAWTAFFRGVGAMIGVPFIGEDTGVFVCVCVCLCVCGVYVLCV